MRRSRSAGGFTLVEMLVVIAIILILMALLAMLIKGIIDRGRENHTKAIVKGLKMGCENYKTDEGVYPPSTYQAYTGAEALHFLLGRERTVFLNRGASNTVVKRDPYIAFQGNWLEGNPPSGYPNPPRKFVDGWGWLITYQNPKAGAAANVLSYLVESPGKDGAPATGDEFRSDKTDD